MPLKQLKEIPSNSDNKLCAYICSKGFFAGLIFGGAYFRRSLFSEELIFGGAYYWKEFCVSKWVGLDDKNSLKRKENSLKQLKTANPNSPWAYIRESLLSEGFLQLRFGGAYFSGGPVFGGAYYRDFTALRMKYNIVKTSNWREANQMAIYKHS